MPDITFGDRTVAYTLRRSARSTVGLVVDREGLTVTAPQRLPVHDIHTILQQKARWILSKLDGLALAPAPPGPRRFVDGEALPYRGQTLILALANRRDFLRAIVRREGEQLVVIGGVDEAGVERAVRYWYLREAAALAQERVAWFAPITGKAPSRLTVKDQRRRWGSCNAQGAIALNWRLVLAPPPAADFVIVHELCHLHRMDHSPAFWQLVENILPDWKTQRAWLRDHGATLTL